MDDSFLLLFPTDFLFYFLLFPSLMMIQKQENMNQVMTKFETDAHSEIQQLKQKINDLEKTVTKMPVSYIQQTHLIPVYSTEQEMTQDQYPSLEQPNYANLSEEKPQTKGVINYEEIFENKKVEKDEEEIGLQKIQEEKEAENAEKIEINELSEETEETNKVEEREEEENEKKMRINESEEKIEENEEANKIESEEKENEEKEINEINKESEENEETNDIQEVKEENVPLWETLQQKLKVNFWE